MLTTATPQQAEDDIDLLKYGRVVASYWILLAACAAVGGALALFLASRAPIRYQASATMAVTQPMGTPAFALSPATARTILANLTLVSETISELQLDRDGLTPTRFVTSALQIQPLPTTNLVRVTVALPDPTKAREAARILSQKAVELSRRLDQEGAVSTRDAIKQQVDEAAQRLDAAQSRLIGYRTTAQVDMLSAEADSRLEERGELPKLTVALEGEKARLARLEEELTRHPPVLSAPRAGILRGVPSSDTVPFEGNDPYSNPVHSMLQYAIAQSRARVSSLEQERRAALATSGGTETLRQLNDLYRRRVELARLEAEYDVAKRVYSDLVVRHEEARSRVVASTPQLQIVEGPVQPDAPLPRRRAQYTVLGVLLGLTVGVAAALLMNRRFDGRSI